MAGGLTRITFRAPEVYNASDSAGSLEKLYITIELDDSLTGGKIITINIIRSKLEKLGLHQEYLECL